MRRLAVLVAILACLGGMPVSVARADDGIAWRRTSPRVGFQRAGDTLELVLPRGRARGAASEVLAVLPAGRYRAIVELDADRPVPRGAFLRVALYSRSDGAGRQRLVLDSMLGPGGGTREVAFAAPSWAHAARLRILARPDRRTRVEAWGATLEREATPPEVVLREGE